MKKRSTPTVVRLKRRRSKTSMSDAEERRIREMHSEQKTPADMAEALNRPRQTVYVFHTRLGLKPHLAGRNYRKRDENAQERASSSDPQVAASEPSEGGWYGKAKVLLGVRLRKGQDCWYLDGHQAAVQVVIRAADALARSPEQRISRVRPGEQKPLA